MENVCRGEGRSGEASEEATVLVQKKDDVAWAQVAAEDRRDQTVFWLFLPQASALCSNSEDSKLSP